MGRSRGVMLPCVAAGAALLGWSGSSRCPLAYIPSRGRSGSGRPEANAAVGARARLLPVLSAAAGAALWPDSQNQPAGLSPAWAYIRPPDESLYDMLTEEVEVLSNKLPEDDDIKVYFGVGNFKHMQHELALEEARALGRRGIDISSKAGFAGSIRTRERDRLCEADAYTFKHTQVVQVTLPPQALPRFANLFFSEVSKRRDSDRGFFFRPVIGIRKGMASPYFPVLQQSADGIVKLEKGVGEDPDVEDLSRVYVYDSRKFQFRPAEKRNQFVNPMYEKYETDYGQLSQVQEAVGKIATPPGCPL